MTLNDKVERYLDEARDKQVDLWTAAPPATRLLWRFGVDAPPPPYWSLWRGAIYLGVPWGVLMFVALSVLQVAVPPHILTGRFLFATACGLAVGAPVFGASTTIVIQWACRRMTLPP